MNIGRDYLLDRAIAGEGTLTKRQWRSSERFLNQLDL